MKNRTYLAAVFLAVSTFLTPFAAVANNDNQPATPVVNQNQAQPRRISVYEFNKKSHSDQAEYVVNYVDKLVAEVKPVNPALSKAIHDYFYVDPSGKHEPPGMMSFAGGKMAVERLAQEGKLDLTKVQVEDIILDIVKTEVMPQVAKPLPAPGQP